MFFAFCSLFFVFLSWRRFSWSLFLIVLCPFSYLWRTTIFGLPTTFLEIMILTVSVVWLIKKLTQKSAFCWSKNIFQIKKIFGSCFYPLLALLIFSFVSIFFSLDKIGALGIWRAYFLEPLIFGYIFFETFQKVEIWPKIEKIFEFSSLFVSVPAIIQKFTGWGINNPFWRAEETRRAVSWFGFPNAVGLFLAPLTVICFAKFWRLIFAKEKKTRGIIFCLFVFLTNVLAMFFAKSEGALIGSAGGCLFYLFYFFIWQNNDKTREFIFWRRVFFSMFFGVLFLTFCFPISRNYFVEKITLSDHSGQIRRQMWSETWQMLKDGRLITGAGLNNYQTAIKKYHAEGFWLDKNQPNFKENVESDESFRIEHWQPLEIYQYPHNIFLNFWSEIGLFGLLAFLFVSAGGFYQFAKSDSEERKIKIVFLSALSAILIHGLVDVIYLKNDLAIIFLLLICLLNKKNK